MTSGKYNEGLSTEDKAKEIIRAIIDLANQDKPVAFSRDWGGNNVTVEVGGSHTHVGWEDYTFEEFVDSLYATLLGGPGLSWVQDTADKPVVTTGKETEHGSNQKE